MTSRHRPGAAHRSICLQAGALLSGPGLVASSQCRALWQLYVTYGVMLGAAWKSTGVSGAPSHFSAMFLGDDVATLAPSSGEEPISPSRCRVDGVEVDAAIQDERAVNLMSTQVGLRALRRRALGVDGRRLRAPACHTNRARSRREGAGAGEPAWSQGISYSE